METARSTPKIRAVSDKFKPSLKQPLTTCLVSFTIAMILSYPQVSAATPLQAPTVPTPPRNLHAYASDGRLHIAWDPPASNGGSPISGYKVYRSANSNGTETFYRELGNITDWIDTYVEIGYTYYYLVTAVNEVGESDYSNRIAVPIYAADTLPGWTLWLVVVAIPIIARAYSKRQLSASAMHA